MRVPFSNLTDEQIQSADTIAAIDLQTGASRQVFGHASLPRIRSYPSNPNDIQVLEVEVERAGFHELCQRVAAIKVLQKDESARQLARKHYEIEAGLTRVIRFSGSADILERAREPIKLLEVNANTVPTGVMALGFDAAPDAGIRFPSVIIEVTPDEFEKIQTKELKLPQGWEGEREEVPKQPDGSGRA
jgi:hypothetical protein